MHAAADEVIAEMTERLEANRLRAEYLYHYLYLNDAGRDQPVFQSYPAANLARLKRIRNKCDPLRAYTDLMLGGWKGADV